MHVFKDVDRRGAKKSVSRKWQVRFRDHNGVRRQLKGFKSKRATEQLGQTLADLADWRASSDVPHPREGELIRNLPAATVDRLAEWGMLDATTSQNSRQLTEHLQDYRQHMIDKGDTARHVKEQVARIQSVIDECAYRRLSDISGESITRELAGRVERGTVGKSTRNHYLRAFKSFTRWAVAEGRLYADPLAGTKPVRVTVDEKLRRRALTDDEVSRLIAAAEDNPEPIRGMPGHERSMLYRLCVQTGLRWSEAASLTGRSFNLDGDPATLTVAASDAKNRREATLPLPDGLSAHLRAYMSHRLPSAPLFTRHKWRIGARMLRQDLDAAGIPYEVDGRIADFHSLRHTFITNLARSGVHPRMAQELARHSSIDLTMRFYTHITVKDLAAAVNAIPEIAPAVEIRTGTDGETDTITPG